MTVIRHDPPGVFPPYRCNVRLRMKYLGDHKVALTVVCCRLLDPRWKLEVEAMASK